MSNNEWFKMPYYHVYIPYTEKKRHRRVLNYNLSKQSVEQKIAIPYMRNKAFMVVGKVIHPSQIRQILIFRSDRPAQEIVLPNGKTVVEEEDAAYIGKCLASKVKGVGSCTSEFITSLPEKKEIESLIGLMDTASFLGLDDNWSSATCALQLQEVSMKIVAKKRNIELNKATVEKILNKEIKDLSFNDRYEAFSKQVKGSFGVEMPILTTHLRRIRAKILHEGYNPKPEETDSIVGFTIGLLKKLEDIA